MDEQFDIHPYLVSMADMEEFEDEAEFAADQLNEMLHIAAGYCNQYGWSEEHSIQLIEEVCFIWFRDPALTELESDEMDDYITNLARRQEQQREEDSDDKRFDDDSSTINDE